jgi:chemotaxis protein MotA
MKRSVLISLAGGLVLVTGMLLLSPHGVGAFFSIPGLLVVIGGTLAATLLSRPLNEVRKLMDSVPKLFRADDNNVDRDIAQLLQFAQKHRFGSPRAAENALSEISNPFVAAGLRQVVEGCSLDDLTRSLQWRIAGLRAQESGQTQILYTMAAFAPAFGMLGTLFGLVHMLTEIGDAGLNQIGSSMAFAMVTTVYGIIASNLVFKPLAIKMERRTGHRLMQMSSLMEGVLQVHQKRHPMLIKEALDAYFAHCQTGAATVQVPLTLVKA